MKPRRHRQSGFAPFGDLAVKMLVFALVFLVVALLLAGCGVPKRLSLAIAAVVGVVGSSFSRVK